REEHNNSVAGSIALPRDPAAVLTLDEPLVARNRPPDAHTRPPLDSLPVTNHERCIGGVSASFRVGVCPSVPLTARVTFPNAGPFQWHTRNEAGRKAPGHGG